jgi:hypothetical protein
MTITILIILLVLFFPIPERVDPMPPMPEEPSRWTPPGPHRWVVGDHEKRRRY